MSAAVGVVAIGRNEGERFRRCLESLVGRASTIVYVDSASTDGSVEHARERGVEVVELDMSRPFTAARARNEGMQRLLAVDPSVEFVQFVDGDCVMSPRWLEEAAATLEKNERLAAVCGRLEELRPDASVYNLLCDLEWNQPVGETKACGGIAMMRVEAFRQVDGFDDCLIAGEEPELCVRLRKAGWKILRIDAPMGLHDAAMFRFGQWLRRNIRAGYAFAEGSWIHGAPPERHWVREARSNWFWGAILPTLILVGLWPTGGWSSLLLLSYPVQTLRIYRHSRRQGRTAKEARLEAGFLILSKFPQVWGQWKFIRGKSTGRRSRLIEYKTPTVGAASGTPS